MKMNQFNKHGTVSFLALVMGIAALISTGCKSFPKPPKGWNKVSTSATAFEIRDSRYPQGLGEKAANELEALLVKTHAFQVYQTTNDVEYLFRGAIYNLSRSTGYKTVRDVVTISTNTFVTNKTVMVTTVTCSLTLDFYEPRSKRKLAIYSKDYSRATTQDTESRQAGNEREVRLEGSEADEVLRRALDKALRELLPEIYKALHP